VDPIRDVIIKVVVEDMDHCSKACAYLEGDDTCGLCTIFGSVTFDKATGSFSRHSECYMSER
jgi:hypothetical protein